MRITRWKRVACSVRSEKAGAIKEGPKSAPLASLFTQPMRTFLVMPEPDKSAPMVEHDVEIMERP